MEGKRGTARLAFQLEVRGGLVNGHQVLFLLEEGFHDLVGDLLLHVGVADEDIPHLGGGHFLFLAGVALGRDDARRVERAVLRGHLGHGVAVADELERDARGGAQVGDRGRRDAAVPEIGVDLAVFQRAGGFRGTEPVAGDVLVRVDAGGLKDAQTLDLGAAARGTRGHPLALQVRDLVDPLALEGHEVHGVRVEHREGPQGQLLLELALGLGGVETHIGHDERHVGLLGTDEQAVVDGGGGHLGGGLGLGDVLGDDVGDGAAQRIVDAPGPARGDRQPVLFLGVRRSDRQDQGKDQKDGQ